MGEDNLGSPVREGTRTPTHAKRKASRKVRAVVHLVDDRHRVIKDLLDINYSQMEWIRYTTRNVLRVSHYNHFMMLRTGKNQRQTGRFIGES